MKTLSTAALILLASLSLNARVSEDRVKAVIEAEPQHIPSARMTDAPLMGNGDIGVSLGGNASHLVFYVGKNDFWRAMERYPGGIQFPGAIDIKLTGMEGASYHVEQLPFSAELKGEFKTDDTSLKLRSWTAALDNCIVIELEADRNLQGEISIDIPQTEYSKYESGTTGKTIWATRSFDDASVLWPTHVAFALNCNSSEFTLKKGQKKTFAIWVYTNHDTDNWKDKAIEDASRTTAGRIASIRKRHNGWWKGFWKESSADFEDEMLMKYYYQSNYILAMSMRSGKMSPGIWGPFATRDDMMWGGDYHLNYNYQSPYWSLYGANHISLTDNFLKPVMDYMDAGRWHARTLLDKDGIYYPVGLGPNGLCTTKWPDTEEEMLRRYASREIDLDNGYKFLGQKINAVFSVPNILMRHYSTLDREHAETAYPYMLACADFWEDYLKWEEEGNRYVIEMDHFNEVYPNKRNNGDWRRFLGDFNSTLSLGLVKGLFQGMIDMSQFLGRDADRVAKWEHILAHLSEIPLGENSEGRISIKNMERGPGNSTPRAVGLNRVAIHALVVPNGICGPVSTPEFNRILLADVNDWGKKRSEGSDWARSMGNGIETNYPAAARVGYDPAMLLEHLKERIEMAHYDNAVIIQSGGGLETFTAVPMTINEMLCQSYEGVLRIFPNWDMNKDASFSQLRAYGAFLVSASVKDGKIGNIKVVSEKGQELKLENPWKGQSVKINGKSYEGDIITVNTKPGQKIRITQ